MLGQEVAVVVCLCGQRRRNKLTMEMGYLDGWIKRPLTMASEWVGWIYVQWMEGFVGWSAYSSIVNTGVSLYDCLLNCSCSCSYFASPATGSETGHNRRGPVNERKGIQVSCVRWLLWQVGDLVPPNYLAHRPDP